MPDKPRIVVAGQIPPPMGGQNAMIAHLLGALRGCSSLRTDHLEFRFTTSTTAARKGQLSKMVELAKVIHRLIKLRSQGPIDLMVYPPGGPQTVPLIRDLLLLPWVILLSRRIILHFHAAGFAETLRKGGLLPWVMSKLYSRCGHAIVMTNFNRQDPEVCGITDIVVSPHRLEDVFQPEMAGPDKTGTSLRILSMGHLCADKGIPLLIRSVARLRELYPETLLELAGEPLAPYTWEELHNDINAAGLAGNVELLGVVSGEEKNRAFARADLFVFPSVAPYESFGLVLAEAMMWSLPIIASAWRGNADVADGSSGTFLFSPPDSVESLCHALEKFAGDRENWRRYGEANRGKFTELYLRRPEGEPLISELSKIVMSPQS